MTTITTATVETLTAEVRVLMVGSRQITTSVAKQLDAGDYCELEPFGRVRIGDDERIIGRSLADGTLITSRMPMNDGWIMQWHLDGLTIDADAYPNQNPIHGAISLRVAGRHFNTIPRLHSMPGDLTTDAQWAPILARYDRFNAEAAALPLIVLAGLR